MERISISSFTVNITDYCHFHGRFADHIPFATLGHTHERLGTADVDLPSDLFLSGIPTETLHAFTSPPCVLRIPPIITIVPVEGYKT
jgi:hypothetical protein